MTLTTQDIGETFSTTLTYDRPLFKNMARMAQAAGLEGGDWLTQLLNEALLAYRWMIIQSRDGRQVAAVRPTEAGVTELERLYEMFGARGDDLLSFLAEQMPPLYTVTVVDRGTAYELGDA